MSLVLDKYDVMDDERSMKYFSFTFGVSQFFGKLHMRKFFKNGAKTVAYDWR